MNFEDHFSELAETYSKYRPNYPKNLFEYLASICNQHQQAWDCGTGNGQAAISLTEYFEKVYATDASKEQLAQAPGHHPKIIFRNEPAEKVSLADKSTDLVTVAAAVHWFNFEKFYAEVKRVLKPNGVIAVWGYHLFTISPKIDKLLIKYYREILNDYWPEQFHYVDTRYTDLPFPFDELSTPNFEMITEWNLDQVAGFLSSWSGTKIYQQKVGRHPLNEIWDDLLTAWGDEQLSRTAHWPLYIRIGKKV
jgi:ubiquinone/menaquinone biosynthesis C-methylase UbiE